MKKIYVSLIALMTLCTLQTQTMQKTEFNNIDKYIQSLINKTEEKNREIINAAGENYDAITKALTTLNDVQYKILQHYNAAKAYNAALEAKRQNPNYKAQLPKKLKEARSTKDGALKAYRDAYGELAE